MAKGGEAARIALCFSERVVGGADSGATTMKKLPCLAGARHGIPLLSAGARLSAAGMLVATAFLAVGQTQPQSNQQQPESFVAVVADAQGLPSVPADQRPSFGTYWKVRNSYLCVTA